MSSSHADELETLLRSKANASRSELKAALTRLTMEVKDRAAQGSSSSYDFFTTTVSAVSKIKGSAHADLRFICIFESAQFFHRTGYAVASLHTLRLLDELANKTKDHISIQKSEIFAGIVYAESGNVAEGVIRYARALRSAQERGDVRTEAVAFNNLSVALNYGGMYLEALGCSRRATALALSDPMIPDFKSLLATSYTNVAQSYLYLEDFAKGFEAIQRALGTSEKAGSASDAYAMTLRNFIFVQLALELGKLAQARDHSDLCRTHSQWGNNPRCKVVAAIAAGLCEIRGGSVERGLEILQSALEHSTDHALRIDALAALVRAFDEACKPEQALKHMEALLATVRDTRGQSTAALLSLAHEGRLDRGSTPDSLDLRILESREAQLRAQVAVRETINSRTEMLERLAVTADLKEETSGEHGYRVGRLAALIATDIGWDKRASCSIDLAARLHDIGKIGVPDRILLNSASLRDAERYQMRSHTKIGAELLGASNVFQLRMAEEIAHFHHERWDGSGYPAKLSGKRIPIHARIVALADVFDALTHGRPFASPWPIDRALEEIRNGRGTQFDPDLTDIFLKLIGRLQIQHPDLDEFLGKAGRNSPFLQARVRIRQMLAQEGIRDQQATVSGNQTRH
jgi:putative two-component system response regulator